LPSGPVFRNEPTIDFARDDARRAMQHALSSVATKFGREYQLFIGGRDRESNQYLPSYNPSHNKQLVGQVAAAGKQDVADAVAAAKAALPAWNALGVGRRAEFLERAAVRMAERRFELAAWEVYECGKPWREADADV